MQSVLLMHKDTLSYASNATNFKKKCLIYLFKEELNGEKN